MSYLQKAQALVDCLGLSMEDAKKAVAICCADEFDRITEELIESDIDFELEALAMEVDEDIEKLIRWRDSLALDDWGDGLSLTIMSKILDEEVGNGRVPKELEPALKKFKRLDEDTQYQMVFSILKE